MYCFARGHFGELTARIALLLGAFWRACGTLTGRTSNLPGYFYLHRAIPFYDAGTGPLIFADQQIGPVQAIAGAVTHVVSADPSVAIPGFEMERNIDGIRILRRTADTPTVRRWQQYAPTITGVDWIMSHVDPDAPPPPADYGTRFGAEAAAERGR